eukprot:CAMPEP_0172325364 /NCGR_PEP_ID=MMETSP1058-20130122/53821_1 /TAXON_ID=83371 /ORGANISM="Detonula confervacea, Strain CCMP 353" /LENGTH=1030 /DNA_ID=CAMNT_0013041887 /DNA_START=6 /DNA_END=3098 /DNA_ORIENTATION=-
MSTSDSNGVRLELKPHRPSAFRRLSLDVYQTVDRKDNKNDAKLEFKFNPETIRFMTYVFFWTMCILAIIITKYVARPILLAGPMDGKSCPPFETGEGFDIYEDSHLIRIFGFNNICSNWDYSPSREIIAAYFPLFEYSLVLYILADFLNVAIHHKKGLVSTRYYTAFKICFPFMIIFSARFRLIFVGIAYINVSAPTFGFLLLQIALVMVACLNVWFIIEAKIEYHIFRGHIKVFAYTYLVCNLCISAIKIYLTALVVTTAGYPSWAKGDGGSVAPGQIIDYTWMVFNAILPLIFSFVRSRSENPLKVTIDLQALPSNNSENCIELVENEEGQIVEEAAVMFIPREGGGRDGRSVIMAKKNKRRSVRGAGAKSRIIRPPLGGTHPNYPFENVVFQGGGAKGVVHCGAIQALDELGILPYLKRFAGTSAGCAPALFLALGLDGKQAKAETDLLEMSEFFDANSIGNNKISLVYNLMTKLGMHPGDKCIEYFGELLEKYTGDPDLTFLDLYQMYGTELCISVSNISRQQSEYLHVNTTPDLPIKLAIRASMSVPFLWRPIELADGEKYVDGGVFNNFPLKAFDGFFLSTQSTDSVLSKVIQAHPNIIEEDTEKVEVVRAFREVMATSFTKPNMATIGFRISSDESPDQAAYSSYLSNLETRLRSSPQLVCNNVTEHDQFPDTKKAQAYLKKKASETHLLENSAKFEEAYVELCRWTLMHMAHHNGQNDIHPQAIISIIMIKKLVAKPPRGSLHPELFGFDTWGEFVGALDATKKGYITRTDFGKFWDRFGVRHAYMKNRNAKPINSATSLLGELLNAMHTVSEENLLRDQNNATRICTLNTYYVDMLDLHLDQEDKEFLYKMGKITSIEWIKGRASELTQSCSGVSVNESCGKVLPERSGKCKVIENESFKQNTSIKWSDEHGKYDVTLESDGRDSMEWVEKKVSEKTSKSQGGKESNDPPDTGDDILTNSAVDPPAETCWLNAEKKNDEGATEKKQPANNPTGETERIEAINMAFEKEKHSSCDLKEGLVV